VLLRNATAALAATFPPRLMARCESGSLVQEKQLGVAGDVVLSLLTLPFRWYTLVMHDQLL
jgi:hypothetical protein